MTISQRIRIRSGEVEATLPPTPPVTMLVAAVYNSNSNESLPVIIHTTDGVHWLAADEPAHAMEDGCEAMVWTGDRFLGFISASQGDPSLLQSFDGHYWAWNSDEAGLFSSSFFPTVYGMASNPDTGLVAAIIYRSTDDFQSNFSELAISHDYGNTWTALLADSVGVSFFGKVAIHGTTIVVSGSSPDPFTDNMIVYSADSGTTWATGAVPVQAIADASLSSIVWVNDRWWAGHGVTSFGSTFNTVIFETVDFQTWNRVSTPWDRDISGSSTMGSAWGMFRGGPDGRSVLVLGDSPDNAPFSRLMVTSDAGATWKMLTATDVPATADSLSVLDSYWANADATVDTGYGSNVAVYAFDHWFITNDNTIPSERTPQLLVGSADFTEWTFPQLGAELIGDGSDFYSSGFGPMAVGTIT